MKQKADRNFGRVPVGKGRGETLFGMLQPGVQKLERALRLYPRQQAPEADPAGAPGGKDRAWPLRSSGSDRRGPGP